MTMRSVSEWPGWPAVRDDLRVAGAGTGAALALALVVSLGQADKVPAYAPVALLALTALTLWRPDAGLACVAFGVPLASWAGRHWNFYVAWAEALVVAFAAGWFLRSVFWRSRQRDALDPPVQIAAVVVLASLMVSLAVSNWRESGQLVTIDFLEMVGSGYFLVKSNGDVLDAAMRLLECFLLFRAASACAAARPGFAPVLIRSVVAAAGIAGALNVWRLWDMAQRTESPLGTFFRFVASLRENVHYADLNAAGSFFILVLFPAIGLARKPGHRLWIAPLLLIGAGLWVTGSRAALAAGVVAVLVLLARRAWIGRPGRARLSIALAALLLLATAGAAAHYLPHRGNQRSSLDAIQVRWELAKTSFRMTGDSPVFGVGVGQYYSLSGAFASPELLRLFPPAQNENAHNNFLQILAELGIVGFAAFVWLLVVAARSIASGMAAAPDDRVRWGIAAGLLSFALTCLGGHPLLVDEPAFTFWIVLGAAAGWPAAQALASVSARPSRAVVAVFAAALVVGIPARARTLMAAADMEHAGFGLSEWKPAEDGVRYRLSSGRSTVFLPGYARAVSIPLRPVEADRTLDVQLVLDGQPADMIRVPPGAWYELRLLLPRTDGAARFRRLDIETGGARDTGSPRLMVGKVIPH
jgi:O-antigen ligase